MEVTRRSHDGDCETCHAPALAHAQSFGEGVVSGVKLTWKCAEGLQWTVRVSRYRISPFVDF